MTSTEALQHLAEAESEQLAQWEKRVEAMIREKGGTVSAREFQRALNILFHDVEANNYDRVHRELWDSLQPVIDRLAIDIQRASPSTATSWNFADVGCGTGLATELILRTSLKLRFSALQLVDTSFEMLARCRERSSHWGLPTKFLCGQIHEVPSNSVDILVTSSFLHHIPELVAFCREIKRIVRPGGFYLQIHDPRQGALSSSVVAQRAARLAQMRKRNRSRVSRLPLRILRGVMRRAHRLFRTGYLDEVNRRLIVAGLVKKRLTSREIWSITDLRVGDLPLSATDGVRIDELTIALSGFDCVSIRTYGFFGVLASNLPPELALEERQLFDESSGDGAFLAGVWMRQRAQGTTV